MRRGIVLLCGATACGGIQQEADASVADALDATHEDVTLGPFDAAIQDADRCPATCPPGPTEGAPCSYDTACEYPNVDGGCPRLFLCNGTLHEYQCSSATLSCTEGTFCFVNPYTDVHCANDAGDCICTKTHFSCGDAGSQCPLERPFLGSTCSSEGARCIYTTLLCTFHECRCGHWTRVAIPYPCGK
jgi:hypothetical protein